MYLNFNQRCILLFSWSLFIIVLLLTPMPINNSPESVTFIDKVVHAFLFGVLTFLIFYLFEINNKYGVFNPDKNKTEKKSKNIFLKINKHRFVFLISFLVSAFFSIILEYIQIYIPGRSCNDFDFIASLVGIILVLLFIYGDNYGKKRINFFN